MTLIKRTSDDIFPTFFDDFLGRDLFNFNTRKNVGLTLPAVNIKETTDAFHVELAAPGLDKKDFKVELDDSLLTISYSKEENREDKNEKGEFTSREFNYTSFQRSFTLPKTAKSDKIEARYTDGILNLTIPKKEEAKQKLSRVIDIS